MPPLTKCCVCIWFNTTLNNILYSFYGHSDFNNLFCLYFIVLHITSLYVTNYNMLISFCVFALLTTCCVYIWFYIILTALFVGIVFTTVSTTCYVCIVFNAKFYMLFVYCIVHHFYQHDVHALGLMQLLTTCCVRIVFVLGFMPPLTQCCVCIWFNAPLNNILYSYYGHSDFNNLFCLYCIVRH